MNAALPVDDLVGWLLASVRLLALFVAAPFFGHLAVPARLRVALAMAVAVGLAPVGVPAVPQGVPEFGAWVMREALLGLAIGFSAQLIFAAFALLGEFVSIQGGLGAARVLDPSSGASSVALASGLQAFALMIFLSIEGHHELLRAAALSFERVPVGGGALATSGFAAIAALGAGVYETAVRLALPVTVAMGVANAGIGLLGRAIPQLNLMTLQLPAQVALLLLLLALGVRPLADASAEVLAEWSGRSAAVALGAH